jgi:hypothetical protein
MDAVKFMKERIRMCKNYSECKDCPITLKLKTTCTLQLEEDYEELVKIVENWSKKNPEQIGKKYIIEIDEVDGNSCRIKGLSVWLGTSQLERLEECRK